MRRQAGKPIFAVNASRIPNAARDQSRRFIGERHRPIALLLQADHAGRLLQINFRRFQRIQGPPHPARGRAILRLRSGQALVSLEPVSWRLGGEVLSSRPKWRDRAPSAARGYRSREACAEVSPSYPAVRGKDWLLLERAVVAAQGRAAIPPLRQPPVGMTQSLRPAIL